MSVLIETIYGNQVTVKSDDDFMELIRKYIGHDAADWYYGRISDMDEAIDDFEDIVQHLHDRLDDIDFDDLRWNRGTFNS